MQSELLLRRLNPSIFVFLLVALEVFLISVYLCISVAPVPFSDDLAYDRLGTNLSLGRGYYKLYPQAHFSNLIQSPGYPFYLAFLYWLFGHYYKVVYLQQAALFLISGVLVYKLCEKVFGDSTAVLALAAFFGYWPLFIYINRLWPEILASFLLCAFLLGFQNVVSRKGGRGGFWGCGLLLGMTILVKASFIFAWLPLAVYLFWKKKRGGDVAAFILGVFMIVFPWTLRNFLVTGSWVPVSTAGVFNFWTGNFPPAGGTTRVFHPSCYPAEVVSALQITPGRPQDIAAISGVLLRSAVKTLLSHPLQGLRLLGNKFFYFWFDLGRGSRLDFFANPLHNFLNLSILVFSLAGLRYTARKSTGVIWIVTGYLVAVHLLTLAEVRYSLMLMPFMIILASASLHRAVEILLNTWWR